MKHLNGLVALVFVLPFHYLLSGCGRDTTASSRSATTLEQTTIAIDIAESSVTLGAAETYQFSAHVTGTTDTSVNWQVSDCSATGCGSITSSGYYTAPSTVPASAAVKVTATSRADPGKSDYVTVRHEPISVSMAPQAA